MDYRNSLRILSIVVFSLLVGVGANPVSAQTTTFTYQGKLTDSGNLANGNYDLQFKLFDTVTVGTGTQQGSIVTVSNVIVSNGIFTVSLDFGVCATCFNGAARFLEIAVRLNGGGSFTTLTPRQPVTSTPYAINAAQLGGLAASGFLQNSTSQQAASNFNISGDGTAGGTLSANFVNATTRYNLNGQTLLSAAGTNNLFAGINAGTTGSNNAFFGAFAGNGNTTGINNAFFGTNAGQANTGASQNAFFGTRAGQANTTGSSNAFFGFQAGLTNTTGVHNTFIGSGADFFLANSTGDNNTLLGANSAVLTGGVGINNATAIGFQAQVSASNSLILGSINGVNGATADTKVGIGTNAPSERLHVNGNGLFNGNLTVNGTLTASLPAGSAN